MAGKLQKVFTNISIETIEIKVVLKNEKKVVLQGERSHFSYHCTSIRVQEVGEEVGPPRNLKKKGKKRRKKWIKKEGKSG